MNTDESFEEFPIGIDEPIYPSGVVSKLLDMPIWILKQLDEEGVVSPPREKGQSRLYSKKELKALEKVWYYMKEKNVKVPGIKIIIEMETRIEELEDRLDDDD